MSIKKKPVKPPQRWAPSAQGLLFFLVLLALVTRAAFLMHSFDEPRSLELARSIGEFKIVQHQPSAPGQFFYVMLVRWINGLVGDELTTLSLASALFSSLALVPLFYTLRAVFDGNERLALGGTVLTAFSYGFWLVGLRPVSDPVACFFVFSTVCALLLGLDRAVWFCVGMACFGVTLGIEPHTVYFLAPLAAAVGVAALRNHRWETCLAGGLAFAVFVMAWLIPSVRNCGGWSEYKALCAATHEAIYTKENILAHLGKANFKAHAGHDVVLIWGQSTLAAVMLAAVLFGLVPLWRMGTRARLFVLFALSTISCVFLAPTDLTRYYVYTAPIFCAAAAAGIFWLCSRRFVGRMIEEPQAMAGAVGILTLASILVTLPVAALVKTFRSPSQSAYEFLLRRHAGSLNGVDLYTDNHAASASLDYLRAKGAFEYADNEGKYPQLLPLLDGKQPFYILSTSPSEGADEHLHYLEHFAWQIPLRHILQAPPERLDARNLYLYELKGTLPDEYQLAGDALQPVMFGKGVSRDGRMGPGAEMILPHDGSGSAVVELQGTIPPEYGFYFPFKVAYETPGGGAQKEFIVEKPGSFRTVLTLEGLSARAFMVVRFNPAEYCIPAQTVPGSTDERRLSFLVKHLQCTSPEHPMRVTYAGGWFNPETDKNGTWRWCGADGAMDLVIGHGKTVELSGDFISFSGGNAVDLMLNGKVVATAETPEKIWSAGQTLRVPLGPGVYHLVFHSRLPAVQPAPSDPRMIAFGVRNLRVVQD